MNVIRRYFLEPQSDANGSSLPFNRANILSVVFIALALMSAVAFGLDARHIAALIKCLCSLGLATFVLLLNRPKKLVLGGALGIMTMRLGIGLVFIGHNVMMSLGFVICGAIAFLLLNQGSIEGDRF